MLRSVPLLLVINELKIIKVKEESFRKAPLFYIL